MTIEDLRNYRRYLDELEQLYSLLNEAKARMTAFSSPSNSDSIKSTPNPKKLECNYEAYSELCSRYDKKISDLYAIRCEIEDALDDLSCIERLIIRYKYLAGLTFEEIADKIDYSERQIRRINERTLRKMSANVR